MGIIFQLTKNTLKECLREPVFYLILITALVMIGLFPTMSMFVFRKQIKLVADSSMATTMLFGLFVAVLCAGHTISREMKNGTVLLLMSKPVPRALFVISKILGILTALTAFVLLCCCGTFISLLIAKDQFQLDNPAMIAYFAALALCSVYGGVRNFLSQKSFASHAIGAMLIVIPAVTLIFGFMRVPELSLFGADSFIPFKILIPAMLLLFPAVWAMGAISAALAIRLDFISNLMICLAVFLAGLVSQYFLYNWFGPSVTADILGSLIPNWQYFWMADALTNAAPIPASYVIWAYVYVLFYIVIWAFWAMFLFHDSELARDAR